MDSDLKSILNMKANANEVERLNDMKGNKSELVALSDTVSVQ